MADDVKIVGLNGVPPWATEDTLSSIEAILKRMLGTNVSLKGGKNGLDPASLDELSKQIKALNKANKKYNHGLDETNKYVARGVEWHRKYGSAQALAVAAMVAVTKTFDIMKDTMVSNVNTFDKLYASGAVIADANYSNADSFRSLGEIAWVGGLRIEKMADVMQKSTGANAVGMYKFAKALGISQKSMTELGFNSSEAAIAMAAYLDSVMGTGSIQKMTDAEIAAGTADFSKRLTKLSIATGTARDKLLQQTAALNSSIEANAVAAEYGGAAAEKMSMFAASFADPAIGDAFMKMMSSKISILNGTVQNFTKSGLGNLGIKLGNFSKSLIGLDPEEARRKTSEFVKGLGDLGPVISQQKWMAEAGVEGAEENLKFLIGLRKEQERLKDPGKVNADMKAAAASAAIATEWEKILTSVQRIFAPSVGLLQLIGAGLSTVADIVEGVVNFFGKFDDTTATATGKLGYEIQGATSIIVGLTAGLVTLYGVVKSLSTVMTIMRGGMSAVAETAFGTSGRPERPGRGKGSGKAGKAAGAGKVSGPGIGAKLGGFLGDIGGGLGKFLASVGTGAGVVISSVLRGLAAGVAAFANPAVLVGSAILSASIAVLSLGLGAAAFVLGKTMPTLADGFKSFDAIDGENLKTVGVGVAALAAGLGLFGAGSVIASAGGVMSGLIDAVGGLFGVNSPIERLREFSTMGPGLEKAGSGMQALANGMAQFAAVDDKLLRSNAESLAKIHGDGGGALSKIGSWFKTPKGTDVGQATSQEPPSIVAKTSMSTKSVGGGVEQPPAESDINSLLAQQIALISVLITKTESALSVSKEILRYTKLQT